MTKIPPDPALDAPLEGPLVTALTYDGLCTFEFAIAAEIFGLRRPEMGRGWYRFVACAAEPGQLRAQGGLRFEVEARLDLVAKADLVIMPGWRGATAPVPAPLKDALTAAHARGARLASICSGAFVLAAAGLLDGRRAATHWRYAEALQAAYPAVSVDASVLYVEDGPILTSAGSAAGIDLLLHVVRSDFGPEAANTVARRLVVQPHRSGGQAQFVERPIAPHPQSRLATLLDRLQAEPTRRWTTADLAREAAMSERSLMRRFMEATGQSPGEWLAAMRVEEAKRLLEISDVAVEEIARRAGFGSPATLRHHFSRATGLSPREHRERFSRRDSPSANARAP